MTDHNVLDRGTAIKLAQEVLTFIETGVDDLIIVADWLLTGRADTALAFAEQRDRQYNRSRGELSDDAASWSAKDLCGVYDPCSCESCMTTAQRQREALNP